MFRSPQFIQARSLVALAARPTPRVQLVPAAFALRRNLLTTSTLSAAKKSGDGKSGNHDNRYVERQNYTPGAKEELKELSQGVADLVSGASGIPSNSESAETIQKANDVTSHLHKDDVRTDLRNLTEQIVKTVPKPAMVFGAVGTLPYLATSITTILLAREASLTSKGHSTLSGLDFDQILEALHTVEHIQITYGAIILSFLGAIHWGFEFAGLGGTHDYKRLALGIVPALIAWPTTFLTHELALVTQWLGFTTTWFIDQNLSTKGWTPVWYSTYRFYLSLIVGFSIIATFAGTGYYGAGAGATGDPNASYISTSQRIGKLKSDPRKSQGKIETKLPDDSDSLTEEGTTSYMVVHNLKQEAEDAEEERKEAEEEAKEKEAKKKENEEFQDKRDEHQQDKAPGNMKSEAKDRTGKNANEAGGEEERPDEEKRKPQGDDKAKEDK